MAGLALVKEPLESHSTLSNHTRETLVKFRNEVTKLLKGKEELVDAILSGILSSGHILLEDVPGVGKTTVIKAIAKLLGLEMRRIQCTSDLLPSDIIGLEIFQTANQQLVFREGPIFANVILADELNRASPRTQSALLEAMGEGFVTVDRRTYELPKPFIVFAAQNPSDHLGTYPLPESQLDRFAIKLQLDYPTEEKETEIFQSSSLDPLKLVSGACLTKEELQQLQSEVEKIFISPHIASYVRRFVESTRTQEGVKRGVSTRGGVTWLRIARGRALMHKRDYIIPDDLIATASYCLSHRIVTHVAGNAKEIIDKLVSTIDIE